MPVTRIDSDGATLRVSGIQELNAANAAVFRDQVRGALSTEHNQLDLDFADLRFLDSSGLGALIALHKTLAARQGLVRILSPQPHVVQVLELTRMHRIFELINART